MQVVRRCRIDNATRWGPSGGCHRHEEGQKMHVVSFQNVYFSVSVDSYVFRKTEYEQLQIVKNVFSNAEYETLKEQKMTTFIYFSYCATPRPPCRRFLLGKVLRGTQVVHATAAAATDGAFALGLAHDLMKAAILCWEVSVKYQFTSSRLFL